MQSKSAGASPKWKLNRKSAAGILFFGLALAAAFYWWHLSRPAPARLPVVASRTVVAATAPAAAKPEPAASPSQAEDKPSPAKTDHPMPAEFAAVGLGDSLMSVFSPSARAETMQPQMQPAPKAVTQTARPAKRTALPAAAPATAAPATAVREPQVMTPELKRLKVAQEGFGNVMNLANQDPDTYGFLTGENLRAVQLGDPIPVYKFVPHNRMTYKGQPVKSLLKPADEWIFPVMLDNQVRFMVRVQYDGHDYVLGAGSRALAMAYDKILARWPASEGFHPALILNQNMPGYFFTIPELPDENITDTGRMFDYNPALSPASVLLASWR